MKRYETRFTKNRWTLQKKNPKCIWAFTNSEHVVEMPGFYNMYIIINDAPEIEQIPQQGPNLTAGSFPKPSFFGMQVRKTRL